MKYFLILQFLVFVNAIKDVPQKFAFDYEDDSSAFLEAIASPYDEAKANINIIFQGDVQIGSIISKLDSRVGELLLKIPSLTPNSAGFIGAQLFEEDKDETTTPEPCKGEGSAPGVNVLAEEPTTGSPSSEENEAPSIEDNSEEPDTTGDGKTLLHAYEQELNSKLKNPFHPENDDYEDDSSNITDNPEPDELKEDFVNPGPVPYPFQDLTTMVGPNRLYNQPPHYIQPLGRPDFFPPMFPSLHYVPELYQPLSNRNKGYRK